MAARNQVHRPGAPVPLGDSEARPAVVVHAGMRHAPGYVHAVHPERPGDGVLTYTPGQLLPDWLLAELEAGGRLVAEGDGVWQLELAKGKR